MDAVCNDGRVGAALLLAALLLVDPAAASAQLPDSRMPLPDSSTQDQCLQLFREVFGEEYDNADTSEKRLALAAKLLQKAIQTPDDPASRYVLLRIARDVSVAAGDAPRALDAVEAIAGTFDVDGLQMKADTLANTAPAARSPAQCSVLANAAALLVDEAVAEDRYELAGQLADVAVAAARNSHDAVFLKRVVAWGKRVEGVRAAYGRTASARAALESDASNPEANLAVGRFLAFTKGDWHQAIPYLALGSDAQLKDLARQELQSPASPADQLKLGEQWWDLAETIEDPEAANRVRARAAEWYSNALPRLTGLTKAKAESRVAAAASSSAPAGGIAFAGGLDQPIPGEIEDIKAAYGTSTRVVDVTDLVRRLYRQDPFAPIHACNALFGDPAQGRKHLYLQYRFGRRPIRRTVREGGFETVPALADPGMKLRDATQVFTVLAARYGARDTWMDVTDAVARLVTDPTHPFQFGVAEAGRDPLAGVDKVLVVWFDYRGIRCVRIRSTRRPCTLLP
jgi:hypothetical protein